MIQKKDVMKRIIIPAGAQGATGPAGPAGRQGPAGVSGYQIEVCNTLRLFGFQSGTTNPLCSLIPNNDANAAAAELDCPAGKVAISASWVSGMAATILLRSAAGGSSGQ